MRRTTLSRTILIVAVAGLAATSILGCRPNSESGPEPESDDSTSVDLSWAAPNPKEGVIQAVTRAHDLTKEDLLDRICST